MVGLNHISNITKKDIIKVVLAGLIIPNIVFWIVCPYLYIDRVFINLDYLLPLWLISFLSFRYTSIVVFGVFFFIFLVDVLLACLQLFPFINLIDIIYLSNFLFMGPITFKFYFIFIIALLLIEYILIDKLSKNINPAAIVLTLIIITVAQSLLYITSLNQSDKKIRILTLANSELVFFIRHHNNNFLQLNKLQPLMPTKYQNATKKWFDALAQKQPLNHKLLLVINESWGNPVNEKIQEETLAKLKTNNNIEYFEQGAFAVIGATVGGELRELCAQDPQLLDLANVNTGFENCLPNKLRQLGYTTTAIHGTKDLSLYNRNHWYPLAGFEYIFDGADFDLPEDPAGTMNAISDLDIFPIIAKSFSQSTKQFYYWMTVTTHLPYSAKSIRNKRFSCQSFDLDRDSHSCRLLILQTQFFDGLSELISRPEMKGVEVIVAGDHPPPMLSFSEGVRVFEPSKVSWIHFKVKDN